MSTAWWKTYWVSWLHSIESGFLPRFLLLCQEGELSLTVAAKQKRKHGWNKRMRSLAWEGPEYKASKKSRFRKLHNSKTWMYSGNGNSKILVGIARKKNNKIIFQGFLVSCYSDLCFVQSIQWHLPQRCASQLPSCQTGWFLRRYESNRHCNILQCGISAVSTSGAKEGCSDLRWAWIS